jgi:GcrA cell cycle regulator
MEWNDETIARLRALWAEGLSTAEIGRRMGISKNAVVGKAHRLLLASRPSPIRRDADGARTARPAAPRRVTGPTLPSLALATPVRDDAAQPEVRPAPAARPPHHPAPPSQQRPLSVAVRTPNPERRRNLPCCWPIGEPGTRSFRFCDGESLAGKPYCETHAALAYVKIRDRREDAA